MTKISMEMPGRRSNYSLLSQYPDDQLSVAPPSFYESHSGDGKGGSNKPKHDRAFDWDSSSGGDHKLSQQSNRIGSLFSSSLGLQRQSSGSSFGGSSLSGECYAPNLLGAAAGEIDSFGDVYKLGAGDYRAKPAVEGSSSGKSWAQQTEESYQLQLALALRLSSEATCADDPNFLDPVPDESALRLGSASSAEVVSHRFWVCYCCYLVTILCFFVYLEWVCIDLLSVVIWIDIFFEFVKCICCWYELSVQVKTVDSGTVL